MRLRLNPPKSAWASVSSTIVAATLFGCGSQESATDTAKLKEAQKTAIQESDDALAKGAGRNGRSAKGSLPKSIKGKAFNTPG